MYWRTIWKYGQPGFRYVHKDVGHALSSLAFAAAAQGAGVMPLESVTDSAVSLCLQPQEPEEALCLIAVYPIDSKPPCDDWWCSVRIDTTLWEDRQRCVYEAQPLALRAIMDRVKPKQNL